MLVVHGDTVAVEKRLHDHWLHCLQGLVLSQDLNKGAPGSDRRRCLLAVASLCSRRRVGCLAVVSRRLQERPDDVLRNLHTEEVCEHAQQA